jgi:hypothetical protein
VQEIEGLFPGYELDWRANDTTIIEVIVDGIGYETEPDANLMGEVASVAGRMAAVIGQYRQEIIAALNSPEVP